MIFKSAEVRWFSKNASQLQALFQQAIPPGKGQEESIRTDYYLKTDAPSTGVKVRQGNHELKLRTKTLPVDWGLLEHWIKWSYPEKQNILTAVTGKNLSDWTALSKKRWIKKYVITDDRNLQPITTERVNEGCGLEFTELEFPESSEKWYTLGLEAFSATGNEAENLIFTIRELRLNLDELKKEVHAGYPEFLARFTVD